MRDVVDSCWVPGYSSQAFVYMAFGVFFKFIREPQLFECFSPQEVSAELWELIKNTPARVVFML